MKYLIRITLFCFLAMLASVLTYFYTDLFYNKTDISISENYSVVLITKLTTKDEIELIKNKFKSIGVTFQVNNATYSNGKLTSINFDIETPAGEKGNYISTSMRITREVKITLNNNDPNTKYTIKIG